MKTILSVLGARPQFIKAAPVSRALRQVENIREVCIHTGQHFDREMSDVFFEELNIPPPAYNLGINGGGHAEMTGRMMIEIEKIALSLKPDAILVYGDTNSTLAGGIVAAKLFVPLAHVEAGLRSFQPMPEEVNRILVDRVSRWLFCPTPAAVDNLATEGVRNGVHMIGDVMYDTTLMMTERARARSTILSRLKLTLGSYSLATIHRAENTDTADALKAVVSYLTDRAKDIPVVLPIHPRTLAAAKRFDVDLSALRTIDPVGYLDMTALLEGCHEVLTDSGGLQKEAYFHRKPCVTLRNATEWVETIEAGWNRLWTEVGFATPRQDITAYGDGRAAHEIVKVLTAEI
ncbi:UDP-N-acetylglucosamine 2-epimerase [Bradyrhizobiaceae bacterium SG-6C]|nr:UDP-N-acetylglucosamine 2-epimerase [Bradyrhizobiaceae bacterium SG-6C]